jgi:hypothetical protein
VLHLRVTCPAEATDAVLDSLRNNSGAVHLTVMRGLGLPHCRSGRAARRIGWG